VSAERFPHTLPALPLASMPQEVKGSRLVHRASYGPSGLSGVVGGDLHLLVSGFWKPSNPAALQQCSWPFYFFWTVRCSGPSGRSVLPSSRSLLSSCPPGIGHQVSSIEHQEPLLREEAARNTFIEDEAPSVRNCACSPAWAISDRGSGGIPYGLLVGGQDT